MGGAAVLLAAALSCGACSTLPLSDDDMATGSITPRRVAAHETLREPRGTSPRGIAAGDWSQAKLALDQAMASGERDISVPWENAETGVRGTATPIGTARAGGCRDFMIAVVDGKTADRWVHGEACRADGGIVLNQVRVLGSA